MFIFLSRLWATSLKKVVITFSFCFALFSSTHHAVANENFSIPQLKFKSLTTQDGLSQSYAYGITEDKQGFMWIATQDGLNRYDGKNFIHYKNNMLDKSSIANNFIRKVFIDNTGTIWVGTQNGLSRYIPNTDNFENFYHDENNIATLQDNVIWDIYQDQNNVIWVTTASGIHYYNEKDNSFNPVRIRNHEKQLKEIKVFFQDAQKNYWLGTYENGIYIVGEDLTNAISLQTKNKWGLSIDANKLSDITVVDNDYWLATDKGVYVVDRNYKLKNHLTKDSTNSAISSNIIKSIIQKDDTQVWIGTRNGLTTFNLHNQKTVQYKANDSNYSLVNNTIYNLFKDSSDNIWVGTYGGINIFSPISMSFNHYKFNDEAASQIVDKFTELSDGSVLLARGDGSIFNISGQKSTKLPIQFDEGISNIISQSPEKIIILTMNNKLLEYNLIQNSLIPHTKWKSNSNYPFESNIVLTDNSLWFFNNKNILTSYELSTHEFVNYLADEVSTTKITSLYLEKNENENFIWATSIDNEIVKFSLKTKSFKSIYNIQTDNYLISNSKSIIKSGKWLWLGSFDQGILLFDIETQIPQVFNENNKLVNNTINGIFVDDEHNAWFSTNKGISSINPFKKTVINYGEQFGIKENEFINDSILYSSEKVAYFGGLNGFHRANLNEVASKKQKIHQPILTNLLISNKKIDINPNNESKKNQAKFTLITQLNNTKTLTLQHEQSPFSLEFISPNAKILNQIAYRYRLKGLEENWIETDDSNRRATYTNLDAGSYTFEVQVIDLLNPVISQTKTLNITIMPPWWLSKLAITVYTLFTFLIFMYFLFQLRQKRLSHLQIELSEERLKLSLWGSGDEMWDWNIKSGKIFRSNIWGILEFPQDGKRNVGAEQTNIHQHDIPRVREALEAHFSKKTDHFEATYRVKDKNERWIWVLDRGKIVERDESDAPTRMTGTLKDISQIKRADERLKLFAKCIENISDAVVIYDRQFTIVDVNKAYQRITQVNKSDMLGKSLRFKQYPESFTQNIKKHLITQSGWHGEIEDKHANGDIYIIDLNIDIIKDENNNISHFVGVFSDVTERKKNEAELRKLANSDTLTGLPNRSYFQANQTRLVKTKVPHALLVFDLDNFKKINDSMGHGVGDALLCKVAQRIISSSRKKDTVYRLGGDEFSIMVENTNDIHTITTIAKNILKTIAQPMKLKNQEVVLYSSIGIVLFPEDGASSQELLKNADTAMYHAKNTGGNKYQFFSESMNKKAVKRLQIENLIRYGLKEDYFSVFYQPKIEISTGKIAGMEALVRFETPSKGIISPVVFIPVSEETGQIIDIGEIVLRKSCFATKKWVDSGLFEGRIAVNLSAVQFTQPNLVGMISDILKESQLPAKHLELEITEGTVMDSPQQAIDTMLQIRAMGIHLSLDDFGTGYSSLAYLKKFPLNTLKIDKAFVDDIETSEQGRNMVATIVTIAHNLGLHVVAEGVETNQQLSFLSGLRCEQLQGYLYSKPLPENDFQKYLLSHQITNKSTSFNN
ncbi:EAL domain-containing protein [Colwellia sp. UCD-KL20]|uniref:EAL domain-containing protein n=1 Tax=Colwellia sp. UCD-KL20 TaxID=1917165 RepID=UPI0009F82159|nr:EAL domain-containing protein [Colwellia sp. UCD-KL20]